MRRTHNLKTPLGLNNYLSELDQHLEILIRCRFTASQDVRIHMYANFLNQWFKTESEILDASSPSLLEFMQQQNGQTLKVLTKWELL